MLLLPSSMTATGLALEIEDQLEKKVVEEYLKDGTIMEVKHYDGTKKDIRTLLKDLPKHWYYAKIASLSLEEETDTSSSFFERLFGTRGKPAYYLKRV